MSDLEGPINASDGEIIAIKTWSKAAEDIKRAIEDPKKKDSEAPKHEAESRQEAGHSIGKDALPTQDLTPPDILPIKDLTPLSVDLHYHKEFTENKTRQVLVYSIIAIFVIWVLFSLIYYMFAAKDDMLTSGSSVISGPFGAVLGYYLAKESQKEQ